MSNVQFPWAGNIRNGVFFLVVAGLFGHQGLAAHDGGEWSLSPALFPLLLSAGLAVLSLALISQGILRLREGRETPSSQPDEAAPVSTGRVILTFALCIAYAVFLPVAGFFGGTAVFLALFCLLIGERRIWTVSILSLLSPAVLFVLFRYGLKVLLP